MRLAKGCGFIALFGWAIIFFFVWEYKYLLEPVKSIPYYIAKAAKYIVNAPVEKKIKDLLRGAKWLANTVRAAPEALPALATAVFGNRIAVVMFFLALAVWGILLAHYELVIGYSWWRCY